MFFALSKIFWTVAQPATLVVVLMIVSVALLWRVPKVGRWFITVVTVLTLLIGIIPFGEYLLKDLEGRYPQPTLPERVDGVIVLGGFVWVEGSVAHHTIQVNSRATRLTAFMALAHKYPNAKLVFTGGSGNPLLPEPREADYVKQIWIDVGLDPARVIWERESRNTYENAVNSKELAQPKPGENWVLITSAVHMPRAVGIFEKLGWHVIPYPVDYITTDVPVWNQEFSIAANFWLLTEALKEEIGMAVYKATGKAD